MSDPQRHPDHAASPGSTGKPPSRPQPTGPEIDLDDELAKGPGETDILPAIPESEQRRRARASQQRTRRRTYASILQPESTAQPHRPRRRKRNPVLIAGTLTLIILSLLVILFLAFCRGL